jgi:uncharacterized membrane protein
VLMPLFSQDNSRRFMVENFGHYLQGQKQASSLEVAGLVLSQPLALLQELVSPPRDTLLYLAGQGLPLLFIPWISVDSWLLMGLPLMGLLLAQGANNPLSINIRYTYLVVPGLFAGTALWWQRHQSLFASRRLRRVWAGCILLSLLFTLGGNPNRSLSWIIPDSIQPWVYSSPWRLWQHAQATHAALALIPADASVAAGTQLIPHLAARQVLIRFPDHRSYQDREGREFPVDWIAVDLNHQMRYAAAFPQERRALKKTMKLLQTLRQEGYRVQLVNDGVVLLQRNGAPNPSAQQALDQLLQQAQA